MLCRSNGLMRKAIVGVKRTLDYSTQVRVNADKTDVVKDGTFSINPFCEIAVEAGVQLKEKQKIEELIAVSIGGPKSAEILKKKALALGADRAVHVKLDKDGVDLDPLAVAKLLKAVAEKEGADLVLLGKQSVDGDYCTTAQMTAGVLDWPQGTFASKLELEGDKVKVTREVDTGLQEVELDLPAVISCDLRLNTPRFAKLKDITKAGKKKIDVQTPADLGVDIASKVQVVEVNPPPQREGGAKVESAEELWAKIKPIAKP